MNSVIDTVASRETPTRATDSSPTQTLELLFKEAKQRERRRRLRWIGLIVAVVLVSGVAAKVVFGVNSPAANASNSLSSLTGRTSAKVLACQGGGVVRPRNFVVTCADGNTQLTNTNWTSWTSQGATGTTTFAMNLCVPYCAASKVTYYPNSVVRLSAPVATKHGSLFSLLSVRYRSGGRSQIFHFSYRGDPSFTK